MQRAALLVIDMQVGMFEGELFGTMHEPELLLSNACRLIDMARKAALDIVYIQHCAFPGQILIEGSAAWAIQQDIRPAAGDTVVLKKASSAFEETQLHAVLQEKQINTVITCGLQSEFCVTNTSVSALELGYAVIVAEDCHSTFPSEGKQAADIVAQQNEFLVMKGAQTLSVDELVNKVIAMT